MDRPFAYLFLDYSSGNCTLQGFVAFPLSRNFKNNKNASQGEIIHGIDRGHQTFVRPEERSFYELQS